MDQSWNPEGTQSQIAHIVVRKMTLYSTDSIVRSLASCTSSVISLQLIALSHHLQLIVSRQMTYDRWDRWKKSRWRKSVRNAFYQRGRKYLLWTDRYCVATFTISQEHARCEGNKSSSSKRVLKFSSFQMNWDHSGENFEAHWFSWFPMVTDWSTPTSNALFLRTWPRMLSGNSFESDILSSLSFLSLL